MRAGRANESGEPITDPRDCPGFEPNWQSATIFNGLSAAKGPAAVGSVRTFLDRVAALRQGSDDDKAAAELLARRKILDPATQDQLEGWLKTARKGSAPVEAA